MDHDRNNCRRRSRADHFTALISEHSALCFAAKIGAKFFLNGAYAARFVQLSHFGSITGADGRAMLRDPPINSKKRRARKDEWPATCPCSSWITFVKANI
jgi:hypothetical protein